MRSALVLGLLAIVASLGGAVAACGNDSNETPGDDGGAPDGASQPDASQGAAPPPERAPFGLDARPTNATCRALPRPKPVGDVTLARVFPNLPIGTALRMAQPPGDPTRWWAAQRGGKIVSFDATNDAATTVDAVMDVNDFEPVQTSGEGGLLGFAFHPRFAENHYVYVSYTGHSATSPAPDMKSVLARFTSPDGKTLDPKSGKVLLSFDQPFTNHDGGNVDFGPDGYLYIGFGDGGSAGDPNGNGQNRDVLFGKMLRLDVDHGDPYAVPPDNPFASGGGAKEIFAWGLRNPWRWSFDTGTGQLWVGDVGQDQYEEIDLVRLGGDYGWNCREGFHAYPGAASACATASGLVDPIVEYPHAGKGKSVTGGYVYRGSKIPSLVGTYLYADYVTGEIWRLDYDASGKPSPTQINAAGPTFNVPSFAQGLDGEVYVLDFSGKIWKLAPNAPPAADPFPQKLSQTGCVDPADPTKPAPGLIPYGVNAPLWSDGAGKQRWMALPDGAQIHVNADGDWEFPIGAVLVKTFSIGGKPVETRLLMRHDDGGWAGYSYEWSDDGSDATLLPSSLSKQVGPQRWYFPSRNECGACHTSAAGYTLGPENGQLNGDYVYPSTNRISNQIDTLAHIGVFDAPTPPSSQIVAYAAPNAAAPADVRARSYLHANCSMCHRPGSTASGVSMDFRFAAPLADVKVCGVAPQSGDLGVAGAKLVAPGDPARSVVSLRVHTLGAKRMPPLATSVVDDVGAAAIDDWITSIASCP